MPPRKEITRDRIVSAALELIRTEGLDAVTARNLARRMNCSTQPFYQAFDSMEELKAAAYESAVILAQDRVRAFHDEQYPPALCPAIGYLQLAHNERQLFRSVYLSGYSAAYARGNLLIGEEMIASHVPDSARLRNAGISRLKSIYTKISVYIAGLGAMINTGAIEYSPERAAEMVKEIYETVVTGELALNKPEPTLPAAALGRHLGTGANADVFEFGADRVVKLFRSAGQLQQLYYERRNHLFVQQSGLPVPRVYEPVEIDGRPGLIYERVCGQTVFERLFTEEWKNDILTMARLMRQIHSIPIRQLDSRRMPQARDVMAWRINHGTGLTDAEKTAVLGLLAALPAGTCLCHGDLHPLNVIIRAGGAVIIDWEGASIGSAGYDVASLAVIWKHAVVPPQMVSGDLAVEFYRHREEIDRTFVAEYTRLSGVTAGEIGAWMIPAAAARLNSDICAEEREAVVAAVRAGLASRG